jgi:glycine dehydrogenase
MIAIRAEIARVEAGEWTAEGSPLRAAPHPAEDVTADDWDRPYPRELGAYPIAELRRDKYWPPVSRIDNGYGDRNLMCSCPTIEELAENP